MSDQTKSQKHEFITKRRDYELINSENGNRDNCGILFGNLPCYLNHGRCQTDLLKINQSS